MRVDFKAKVRNLQGEGPPSKPLYLREWRKARGLTLVQVAAFMDVHFTLVNKWEKDIRPVESHAIERLGQLFGVPSVALFYKPENAGDAELLSRMFRVLNHMPRDRLDPWLAFGESYVPAEDAAAA